MHFWYTWNLIVDICVVTFKMSRFPGFQSEALKNPNLDNKAIFHSGDRSDRTIRNNPLQSVLPSHYLGWCEMMCLFWLRCDGWAAGSKRGPDVCSAGLWLRSRLGWLLSQNTDTSSWQLVNLQHTLKCLWDLQNNTLHSGWCWLRAGGHVVFPW